MSTLEDRRADALDLAREAAEQSIPAGHYALMDPPPVPVAETIVRPNGKPYRRRKPLTGHTYDSDGGTGFLVMGTHDVDRAKAEYPNSLDSFDLLLVEPQLRWLRLVPWDAYGLGGDRSWVEDEVRGTPCVDWLPPW